MSIWIKGLGPPAHSKMTDITLGYLGWEHSKGDAQAQKIAFVRHFFAQRVKCYSSRANPNTYVDSRPLSRLCFDQRDFTRYLTPLQRAALRGSDYSAAKINGFIQQLHRRGGVAKIAADLAHYYEYPTLATVSYLVGADVSVEQVTSVCLLYHAIQQFIKERYFVEIQHRDGYYQSYSRRVQSNDFFPPMRTYSVFKESEPVRLFFNLNKEQMDVLLDKIRSKPDSEHYYHTIELPLGPLPSPGHLLVSQIMNRFKPVKYGNDSFFTQLERSIIVVPSFSMLQECAGVLYGKQRMTYVPLIGECTKKVIMHFKMQDKCVFQVGTKEAPLPVKADGHYYGVFCRALHDWYHGERGNWLGHRARRVVRYLAGHVLGLDSVGQAHAIVWAILDGELWKKEQNFSAIFTLPTIPWTDTHKRVVLRNMALLHAFWKAEFGIDRDILYPREKSLYDAIASTLTQKEKHAAAVTLFNYYNSLPQKDSDDYFCLGCLHNCGYGTATSHSDALRQWKLSDNPQAWLNVSVGYRQQAQDVFSQKEALRYCRQAAEAGHKEALFDMGWWYYSGSGFVGHVQRCDLALQFFIKAGKQGHSLALFNVGIMYRDKISVEGDLKRALRYFQRAATLHEPNAQFEIGLWYFYGKNGIVPQDFEKARHYLKEAAKQDHPKALSVFGQMCEEGLGEKRDPPTAYFYVKRAADLGEHHALNQLGHWYAEGYEELVGVNLEKAKKYFAKALDLGNQDAGENLKIVQARRAKQRVS